MADGQIERLLRQLVAQAQMNEGLLRQILGLLRYPTGFKISFEGENMAVRKAAKASLDFQLQDNGTANATLTLVDAAGLATTLPAGASLSVPAWVSSNPAIVATAAADGMSAVIAPATPPVLVTGVTITVGPAILTNADGSTVTIPSVVSQGIDVVGGGPAGFSIQL